MERADSRGSNGGHGARPLSNLQRKSCMHSTGTPGPAHLPTNEFAREIGVKPQTLRKHISQNGDYFGVKPEKMKNGKWSWPASGRSALVRGAR
jgi:hypothetical protein